MSVSSPHLIPGFNLNSPNYFSATWPFNNLLLGSGEGWVGADPATVDSQRWVVNAPNGWSYPTQIYTGDIRHPYGQLRPGNYTVTWNAPGWNLVLFGGSVGSIVENVAGRYTVNVPIGNVAKDLNLQATNATGGISSLGAANDVRVVHSADESALSAGNMWQTDYVSLHKEARIRRFMDIMQANLPGTTALEWSSIQTLGARTYSDQRWPYELIAMLSAAVGSDMWLSFPVTCTRDHYRRAAAKIQTQSAFQGSIYLEVGNECWLFAETRNYLKDVIGKGLDPDGDGQTIALYNFSDGVLIAAKGDTAAYNAQSDNHKVANAMGLVMSRLWEAFEVQAGYGPVPGRSRVRRVHAGQAAAFGPNQAALWQYDLAGTDPTKRLKELIDVGAIAPYMDPVATAAIPDISLDGLIRGKNYLNSLSDWLDVVKGGTTVLLPAWTNYRDSLASMSPQAQLWTYEDGVQFYATLLSSQQYYDYTIDTTGFTSMDFGLSIATAFDNGERVHLHSGYASPSNSLERDEIYYIKKNGTNKLWVFTTQANYLADVNGDHAANLDGIAATRKATNFTRLALLDARYKEFLDSNYGRALYQDQKDRVHDVLGVKNFMQFSDVGGYFLGGVWGIKDTQFSPDTSRTQWFRELDVESSGLQETPGAKGKRKKKIRGPYSDPRIYDEYIKKTIAEREGKPDQNVALAVVQEALVAQIEERQQTGYEEPAALSMENQLLSRLAELESKNKRLVSKVHARQHQIDARLEEMKQEEDVTRNILILLHEL